jgi:DNA-binding transcriptional LysR family regulator
MSVPDLNLLIVFDAVMRERNLRRAAIRLNRSQPAVSQAVARLRDLLADQLFRRTPAGVEPTPRAEAFWAEVREPIERLRDQLAPETFDPRAARGEVRIGLADDVLTLGFTTLVSMVRDEAPGLVLRAIETDHQSVWGQVRTGLIDMGVTVADPPPRGLAGSVLANQRFVVLHRADMAPPQTLATYVAGEHVSVSFSGGEPGYVDRRLEALGHRRSVIAWTPRFAAIPDLIARTGAIATLPEPIAAAFVVGGAVAMAACPFDLPEVSVWHCWHLRRQADPLNRWARGHIDAVMTQVLSIRARPVGEQTR